MNKKGFMLVETLVVSVFIFTTLIVLYVQFKSINNGYKKSFHYNTPDSVYKVNALKTYYNKIGIESLISKLSAEEYIDITSCDLEFANDEIYCNDLNRKAEIEKILFTKEDLTSLKIHLVDNYELEEDLKEYINYVKFSGKESKYRLIVKFEDGTFASLVL